jgi:hypothetical protein
MRWCAQGAAHLTLQHAAFGCYLPVTYLLLSSCRVRLRLEAEVISQLALAAAAEAAGVEAAGLPGSGRLEELRVVHNYGHGGSGLTLAWGTAGDAVQLTLSLLQGGAPGAVCAPGEQRGAARAAAA